MERLVEGIQLIKKFWTSKTYFDFDGKYFKANQIYMYTRPRTDLKVYFSGVGPKPPGMQASSATPLSRFHTQTRMSAVGM